MAVQVLKGVNVPTRDPGAANNQAPNGLYKSADVLLVLDRCTWTAAADIGSTIALADVPSKIYLMPAACPLKYTALGAGVTLSIGDVNYPTGLVNALDVSTAGTADAMSQKASTEWAKPLWQLLGYPSDPGGQIRLTAKIGGANAAAGTLGYCLNGTNA